MNDLCKTLERTPKFDTEYVPFISSPFLRLPSSGSAEQWTNQKNKYEGSIPNWPQPSPRHLGAVQIILFYLSMPKKRNLEDNRAKV